MPASPYEMEMVVDLLSANPQLTGEQVRYFARRIIAAEAREDYVEMTRLANEALYERRRLAARHKGPMAHQAD